MSLKSAHGGGIYIPGSPVVIVPVAVWNANWRVRDAEITQSDSGGSSLFMSVIQDNSWEFSVGRDDTLYPEAVGFVPGTILALVYFKLGAGTTADKLANTLVTEVTPVVDNQHDIVRVTVRGKGGFVTKNQALPS